MANKHMKRCSTSLNLREKQIKTTKRHYLTPIRMATVKSTEITSVGEDMERLEPCALLLGMRTGAATIENSTEVPQKLKNKITI